MTHGHHTHDNHTHEHKHNHSHGGANVQGKKLAIVVILNFIITAVEIVGGLLSNSLSLISDAVHNLGDAMGLLLAYVANKISRREANLRHTFGYKRAEILAAFVNAFVLILICLFLFKEAYARYHTPEPIKGKLMLVVAVIGLIANWISVLVLQKDKDRNINMKAAYLHLMGDTLSSVAVIIGGIAIWLWNIVWLDPLITVLVGIYIIYHTWGVLRQSIDILMQGVPDGVEVKKIVSEIENIPQVADIHHLHIWQLNEEQLHFEAHINVKENIDMKQLMTVRKAIEGILYKHHIHHTTLQIGYNCCDGNEKLIMENKKE